MPTVARPPSRCLTRLRQCLQPVTPAPIVADRQSVRLDATGLTIDVATFERLLGDGTPETLERATALYRGDLLDGIGLRDAAFEDWLLVERQRLRHRVEEALTELIAQSLATGAREPIGKDAGLGGLTRPLPAFKCDESAGLGRLALHRTYSNQQKARQPSESNPRIRKLLAPTSSAA